MALQCGIVGLPNVGKSTLFNCLSNAKAQAANFPFCTIEPNVGVITVPDERLNALAELVHPQRIVPTTVERRKRKPRPRQRDHRLRTSAERPGNHRKPHPESTETSSDRWRQGCKAGL